MEEENIDFTFSQIMKRVNCQSHRIKLQNLELTFIASTHTQYPAEILHFSFFQIYYTGSFQMRSITSTYNTPYPAEISRFICFFFYRNVVLAVFKWNLSPRHIRHIQRKFHILKTVFINVVWTVFKWDLALQSHSNSFWVFGQNWFFVRFKKKGGN